MEGLIFLSIALGFHPIWDDSQFDWKSSVFFHDQKVSGMAKTHLKIESWFGNNFLV